MRVGIGYDAHRFEEGRPLVLGGVSIPDHPGLSGFSDGDALCHAITDALLGAVGAGDIGRHFPPGDERWRDADSLELLRRAVGILEGRNYQVVNVDATVVCEKPRIAPHGSAIRERLGEVLRIGPGGVSVKGKTNEGLGWLGAGEGIAVHAVALVDTLEGGGHGGGGTGALPL